MSAAVSKRFPEVVWSAAILRGLDERARGELEAAGRAVRLRRGEVVYRAGEPADSVFVVASGAFALSAVRRGETEAAVIRRAEAGEVFGEEATVVDFGARQAEARCEADGVAIELPLPVLRRALGRSGGAEVAARLERAMRRAATLDLLRTTSFTRALPERDLEVLLDAAEHRHVARGEHVYRIGDAADRAFLVADGLLSAQTEDEGKPRIEAYLGRGDLFGDVELGDGEPRRVAVVASGPAWLVAVPRDVFLAVARRNGAALEAIRRVRLDAAPPRSTSGQTTAHVFRDLYRMRVARSLLVIDQDACVRCGHCAWSCASAHDDGISRLVRRGDRIAVRRGEGDEVAPLLVPSSCQHCKNPSCMVDCPTGAIGRDARGEVFIREELCTGCGSCAKACPWDNIQMAPRAGKDARYPEVAVKCDLCSARPAGPACVASCPTQAIARIDPNEALIELRVPTRGAARAPVLPPRAPAWPYVAGAAVASLGLAVAPLSMWRSGALAGALALLLVAYAGGRRAPFVTARVAKSGRALHVAHLTLGVLAAGATLGHSGTRLPGHAGGALSVVFWAALASGALGALAQALLPRRLARLERTTVLPEELAQRTAELEIQIFAKLSGRSEVVKALYTRVLGPYRGAVLGPVALALSGRSLREEERRLRARVDSLREGRGADRLAGLDELVRLVVEHRAARAVRALTAALRAWVPVHVAAAAVAILLLAVHVFAVWRRP